MKEPLANSQPEREQLNITVESFCFGNTITSLENRMHCTTGTNTSSGIIAKDAELNEISPHLSRPTFMKTFCFLPAGCDGYTSSLFYWKVGYSRSNQDTDLKRWISLSVVIIEQAKVSTDVKPRSFQYFLFQGHGGVKTKILWSRESEMIILSFRWTLKTFPLQQWGHNRKFKDWASQLD